MSAVFLRAMRSWPCYSSNVQERAAAAGALGTAAGVVSQTDGEAAWQQQALESISNYKFVSAIQVFYLGVAGALAEGLTIGNLNDNLTIPVISGLLMLPLSLASAHADGILGQCTC